jgi:hypothetical protein
VPVTHTCNPSYSGGRDQEGQGLKPAQANSSQEKTHTKKGLVEWLKIQAQVLQKNLVFQRRQMGYSNKLMF